MLAEREVAVGPCGAWAGVRRVRGVGDRGAGGFVVNRLAAAIPITPGGVGFVESGMLSVFVALGMALPVATMVVVTYRVIVTWLPTLAGVLGLLRPPSGREAPGGEVPPAGATT